MSTLRIIGRGEGSLSDAELEAALGPLGDDSPLSESCRYIIATPGKQFRSALVAEAARWGGKSDDATVRPAAAAVEMFHAATLAHDDVVDDGHLRRGIPAIGARSGNLVAGFAGGWLFSRAIELVAGSGSDAVAHFSEMASAVCQGEMLELRELHDTGRTVERYFAVIDAKTASLTAFAAWLGATVGGAQPADVDRFERFGRAVGLAFQIADDIIDLIADGGTTGKTPGNDLRQGVYTLPLLYAMAEDAALMEPLLRGVQGHELPELVDRIRDTGALDRAIGECRKWTSTAQQCLPEGDGPEECVTRLASLAEGVLEQVTGMRPWAAL